MQPVDEDLCLVDVAAQCGCFTPHRVCALVVKSKDVVYDVVV
jgi:hypothetical protein